MKEIGSQVLQEITSRIVAAVNPEKIVLFGSHAWGAPTEDSDIDIMVIVDRSELPSYRRAREVYRILRGIRAPVEVVVRTRDEVTRGMAIKTSLERKVLEEGRILHG